MTRGTRDGFILIAVLGVMALVAGLVGAASVLVRSSVEGALAASDELALDSTVQSGIELAGYQLFGQKRPVARVDSQAVRLETGSFVLTVVDEGGRIDLNRADPKLLASAYRAAGLTSPPADVFAALVLDWRDEDDQRSPGGAEAADYAALGLDHRPQNDEFRSVDEIRFLPGLTPGHVEALRPLLTVHNPDGKVNVLAAERIVLLALPGMTPAAADRILALRAAGPAEAARDIPALVGASREFVRLGAGPSFRVLVRATDRRGGRSRVAEVVLAPSRTDDALFYVVARDE